jgi:H+/Cl- antiporter ClcA
MPLKIKLWWNSLPHEQQAALMLFGGAAAAVVKQNFAQTHGCLSVDCLKAYLWAALHGGIAAVVALYIPNSLGKK